MMDKPLFMKAARTSLLHKIILITCIYRQVYAQEYQQDAPLVSRTTTGIALKLAIARAQVSDDVANSGGDAALECAGLVGKDLQHLAGRTSPECLSKAREFYCDRVAIAEKAVRRPTFPGRVEERCPRATESVLADQSDVSMNLQVPGQASIAFLILSFEQFHQLRPLILRLHHRDRGIILVHLDSQAASQDILADFRLWIRRSFGPDFRRVQIFSEFRVHRGGRSMLDVQMRAFQLLLQSGIDWDFFINLSDTHYLAEAASWIGSYLWMHRGTNYARITSTKFYDPTLQGGKGASYDGPRRDDVYIACDRSLAFECEGKLFSISPGSKYPPTLEGITAASGPMWVVLNRHFVEHVSEAVHGTTKTSLDSLGRAIYEDLAALSIPEESFFHTVLMSSSFCRTLVRHDFLYIDLYNAAWRTSPDSDFPFQTPRVLNSTHLFEISRDAPWLVRKIVSSTPASQSLKDILDATISNHASEYWADVDSSDEGLAQRNWDSTLVPVGFRSAYTSEAAVADKIKSCTVTEVGEWKARKWIRPRWLQSIHLTPEVMEVWVPIACPEFGCKYSSGLCWGWLRLVEQIAVPNVASLSSQFSAEPPPIVALRVGCEWEDENYRFNGEVSIIPNSCQSIAVVAYVNNVGYEGIVDIVWSYGPFSAPARQSGGQIPKGFAMFVDKLTPALRPIPLGRWSVSISDSQTGRSLGRRSFQVYDGDLAPFDRASAPAMGDYLAFFDVPILDKRAGFSL